MTTIVGKSKELPTKCEPSSAKMEISTAQSTGNEQTTIKMETDTSKPEADKMETNSIKQEADKMEVGEEATDKMETTIDQSPESRKEKFLEKLLNSSDKFMLTREAYDELFKKVKAAKANPSAKEAGTEQNKDGKADQSVDGKAAENVDGKTEQSVDGKTTNKIDSADDDPNKLSELDIVVQNGVEKLVKKAYNKTLFYLTVDEVFDVLESIHARIGHKGTALKFESSAEYANISFIMVKFYVAQCEGCRKFQKEIKSMSRLKKVVTKALADTELVWRGQIDVLDLKQEDGDYKFILMFQDHNTRFIFLKPLKELATAEVAEHLVDMFTTIGSPSFLDSETLKVEFVDTVAKDLGTIWPNLVVLRGKVTTDQEESEELKVAKEMTLAWMKDHTTTEWSKVLPFVQAKYNQSLHGDAIVSPYQGMFGSRLRLGLRSTSLPEVEIERLRTEVELDKYLQDTDEEKKKDVTNHWQQWKGPPKWKSKQGRGRGGRRGGGGGGRGGYRF